MRIWRAFFLLPPILCNLVRYLWKQPGLPLPFLDMISQGIISPKMEFSTSSVIKESTRYSTEETSSSSRSSHIHQNFSYVESPSKSQVIQQDKVTRNLRPPFVVRHVPQDSMIGQIQHNFSNSKSLEPRSRSSNVKRAHKFSSEVLVDDSGYRDKDTCCTVCRLYRKYFGKNYVGHHHPPFTGKSQVIGPTLKTGHQPRSISPNNNRWRAHSASPWREDSKGYFPADLSQIDSIADSFRDMSFESDTLKKNKSMSNLSRHVYEWEDNTELSPPKKSTKVFFDDNLALEDSDLSYKYLPSRSTYLYDNHYV
ncbi:uncharacterized protein LOC106457039 isoform X1 [Limulus polyphemus]|uniref:Uncharacterized protein LOC106457039 isoform X1 n=1 Tax=Limulus polyphemus TaxID=6850 RepID=A0ABM1S594_LIMPO|nr:uncharacterized protein LOC106457039 isoform X1 [Limulus polyphemus]